MRCRWGRSATDPFRTYLPSSPYVSERTFTRGDFNRIPEHHLWGPRGYYKADFYTKAVARFVSETGYHGCPSVESIRKFIPADKLWHWKGNRALRMRGIAGSGFDAYTLLQNVLGETPLIWRNILEK